MFSGLLANLERPCVPLNEILCAENPNAPLLDRIMFTSQLVVRKITINMQKQLCFLRVRQPLLAYALVRAVRTMGSPELLEVPEARNNFVSQRFILPPAQ